MKTIRLTAAQALVRYLSNQFNEDGERFLAGCWAIFGHGNVAGLGEALQGARDDFPTWRGHNEQTMAHAAIAYAKQLGRRRAMAVTSSIGPGATNMVTAAALAHVNRLPVLLIPGDVFANRGPDPVLQQVEDFNDGTVSANDCFRPVSRYFDRITRPEQLLTALPRAMRTMTDPADCGPVTLAFCQDVQAEAFDYPESFFDRKTWDQRRPAPDARELAAAADAIRAAKKLVIVAGGGVHYSGATETLKQFAETFAIPVAETQAGKSALPWDHPLNFGPIGVTGSSSANAVCEQADLVIGVGTRFQDFTTGSWSLFRNPDRRIMALNVQSYDGSKHNALPLVADARVGLEMLTDALAGYKAAAPDTALKTAWFKAVDAVTAPPKPDDNALPTDMQVVGAVQRAAREDTVVMCAAGTMPGELHKLWKAGKPMSYHMEYGFSCMGYEIAGGIGDQDGRTGSRRDRDDRRRLLHDGEFRTRHRRDDGHQDHRRAHRQSRVRLHQPAADGDRRRGVQQPARPRRACEPVAYRFRGPCRHRWAPMRARSVQSPNWRRALAEARDATKPTVIVIDTDPYPSTEAGGTWWEVAVPEVSEREQVRAARKSYEEKRKAQRAD